MTYPTDSTILQGGRWDGLRVPVTALTSSEIGTPIHVHDDPPNGISWVYIYGGPTSPLHRKESNAHSDPQGA